MVWYFAVNTVGTLGCDDQVSSHLNVIHIEVASERKYVNFECASSKPGLLSDLVTDAGPLLGVCMIAVPVRGSQVLWVSTG